MTPTTKIRLLLVEDHPIVREGLRGLLVTEPDLLIVGEAEGGATAVQLVQRLAPDVVLLDLLLPDCSGVELIVAFKEAQPGLRILVLSGVVDDEVVLAAIRAGADGFLPKSSAIAGLAEAVRKVFRDQLPLPSQLTRKLLGEFAQKGSPAPLPKAPLTRRELTILREMARGLTNIEIAHATQLSDSTIRTHVNHLLRKLGVQNRLQATIYGLKHGLFSLEEIT
jgi:NarL family two-component system response regulator LiaR